MRKNIKKISRTLILLIAFFGIWQGLIFCLDLPSYLLPSPLTVLKEMFQERALLWRQFCPTLGETLMGFGVAILWGILIALLLRLSRTLRYWILPVILISQAIPTFAIAPFLVIWFGFGLSSKVAVTVFALFFPITIAFYDGLQRVSVNFLALAKAMRAKTFYRLKVLEIPSALPGLASGLRMASVWAPMAAVIGEWVGSSKGLGFLMLNANAEADTPLMFSALLVLVIFSIFLYYVVDFVLRKWIFWEGQS